LIGVKLIAHRETIDRTFALWLIILKKTLIACTAA
jgi:hypothetical protein